MKCRQNKARPAYLLAHFLRCAQRRSHGFLDLFSAKVARDDCSVRSDQPDGRYGSHFEIAGDMVLAPITQECLLPLDISGSNEFLRRLKFRIQAQADHDETRIRAKGIVRCLKIRSFGHTWRAPRSPKIQQHIFSSKVG